MLAQAASSVRGASFLVRRLLAHPLRIPKTQHSAANSMPPTRIEPIHTVYEAAVARFRNRMITPDLDMHHAASRDHAENRRDLNLFCARTGCMRALVLLVFSLLSFGCGSGERSSTKIESIAADQAATARTQTSRATDLVWRDAERGFTVTYPETWERAELPLTPHLGDPLELLALGTYSLRPGGDRCAHEPVYALEDLGATDGLIVIFERAAPYREVGYPPRSGAPELSKETNRFCVPGTGRFDSWFSFGESGRAFYALLALGEDASEETRAQLYAIYDSLALDER